MVGRKNNHIPVNRPVVIMPFRQPSDHLCDPFNLKQGVGARDVTRKGGDVSRAVEGGPCPVPEHYP